MQATKPKTPKLPQQAFFIKTFHWLNIISLLLMISSGLQIYNANPVFGGRGGWRFPGIVTLGAWLGGGRHWHFAAMWLFSLNLLAYGIYIFVTQRWQHRFVTNQDIKAIQVSNNPKRKNYSWHRLAYTLIIPVLLIAILTGLGMYKPAQFYGIVYLFGNNWQILRVFHFISVPIVILFSLIHSALALKVGGDRLVKSMFV
jgi:thiosulfate reductase cytochrome b subunit